MYERVDNWSPAPFPFPRQSLSLEGVFPWENCLIIGEASVSIGVGGAEFWWPSKVCADINVGAGENDWSNFAGDGDGTRDDEANGDGTRGNTSLASEPAGLLFDVFH